MVVNMQRNALGRVGIACVVALWCSPGMADDIPVKAWLDTDTVQAGQPFHIMVEMKGSEIEGPELPEVQGLLIGSTPRIRRDSWRISMSGREHVKIRGYRAQVNQKGTVTLPPIAVTIDGRTFHTDPITIEVTDASPQPRRPTPEELDRGRPRTQDRTRPYISTDPITADDIVLLEASIDRKEAYLNEPIILTLTFLEVVDAQTRVRRLDEIMPTTEGFYVFPLQREHPHGRTPLEYRDGRRYRIEERLRVLYPTTTGELTIGPWRYYGVATIGSGFHQERHHLEVTTSPITVEVRNLPEGPSSFTGAVGDFSVSAHLGQGEVVQGVPTTLTLTIVGQGNPHAISRPRFEGYDGFSVAAPASDIRNIPSPDAPTFEKKFTYAITPYRSGDLTFPAFEFCYFNPEQGTYVTETLGPFSLSVRPSENQEPRIFVDSGRDPRPAPVETFATGMLPPVTIDDDLRPPSRGIVSLATPFAVVFPVLAYGAFAIILARRRKLALDPRYARLHRARSHSRKRLGGLSSAPDPASELYRALTEYVADMLNIDGAGLTSADIERILREQESEQWLIDNYMRILRACERARYAGTPLSKEELNALTHGARLSMKEFENHLSQRGKV